MTDAITEAVVVQLRTRAEKGKEKYGTTMERDDLTLIQWLQHLQEELLDGAVYVEKLLEVQRMMDKLPPPPAP